MGRSCAAAGLELAVACLVVTALGCADLARVEREPQRAWLDLRILYAGDGETDYSTRMVTFLREHAARVRSVRRDELDARDLLDTDVLLVDGEIYDKTAEGALLGRRRIDAPSFELLSRQPTVLMGAVGGRIGELLRLKTAWRYG